MRILQNLKLSETSILTKIPLWSASTFLVLLYGYLGFFVVCYNRNIPLHIPSFQTASAIGVYILLYLLLLLILHPEKGHSKISAAIPIGIVMSYLASNFILIASLSIIYLALYSDVFWAAVFIRQPKDREPLAEKSGGDIVLTLVVLIFGGLFASKMMTLILLSTYFFYELDAILEKQNIKPYQLFIVFILIPLYISNNFLAKARYSVAGISQQSITLISTKPDTANFVLIYQDEDNFFLTDSTHSGKTYIKRKSEISEVIVDKPQLIQEDAGLYKYLNDRYFGKSTQENSIKSDTSDSNKKIIMPK
jgi:hypothetical protein